MGYLIDDVLRSDGVPFGELVHIPLQLLSRYVVERPMVAPFEHRPKRLHAVDVSLPVDVPRH